MSMKLEGDGIMLNLDRIMRIVFAEGLYGDLRTRTELDETGRTSIFIRLETLEDEPWRKFDLRSIRDLNRNGWIIFITDRTWRPPTRPAIDAGAKMLPATVIDDADYEIIDE